MAIDIVSEQGIPEILIARNVLPHVSDLHDFLEGLRTCMDNDTLLVIEVHDAGIICAELQYDSIYHEHLCYFTLETIESILHGHGLYLFDLIKSPISGGSMVLFVKNMRGKESVGLVSRKRLEARHLIDRSDAWGDFAQRCERHREQLIQLLQDEKERGRRIAGYGASARSSTLLNYCCIGNEILSAIADKNPLKQHRFTPGTGIRIDSPERVIREHIDTVLVLAWNFLDEISNYLRKELHFKGNIVSPFPNAPFFL